MLPGAPQNSRDKSIKTIDQKENTEETSLTQTSVNLPAYSDDIIDVHANEAEL